jgi:hypothetical protein
LYTFDYCSFSSFETRKCDFILFSRLLWLFCVPCISTWIPLSACQFLKNLAGIVIILIENNLGSTAISTILSLQAHEYIVSFYLFRSLISFDNVLPFRSISITLHMCNLSLSSLFFLHYFWIYWDSLSWRMFQVHLRRIFILPFWGRGFYCCLSGLVCLYFCSSLYYLVDLPSSYSMQYWKWSIKFFNYYYRTVYFNCFLVFASCIFVLYF